MPEENKQPDFWENAEDEVLVMTMKSLFRRASFVLLGLAFTFVVFCARWTVAILSIFAVGTTIGSGVVVVCLAFTLMKLIQGGVEFKKSMPDILDKKVRASAAAARRGEELTEKNGFQKPPTRKQLIKSALIRIPAWLMVGAALFAWLPLWGAASVALAGYVGMSVFGHYFGGSMREFLNMISMMNSDQDKDTWEA